MTNRMMLGLSIALLTACGGTDPEPPAVAHVKACLERSAAMAAADGDDQFLCAVPIFAVDDIRASLDHYRDVLGFQIAWEWGEPNTTFAAVRRGHVDVYFCEQCQGAAGTYISIFVRDVDEVFREYQDRGAKIVRAPRDEEWGLREMWIEDLDGHVLRVGNGTH